jgi:REP element-mobilizing transposase RayT
MPHSFASLIIHTIFSTKERMPALSPELASRLFPFMAGIVRERKGIAIVVNGPADHVHTLVAIPITESVAELLRVVKSKSSRWVHERFLDKRRFGWQSGYAAFSVSGSRPAEVEKYIANRQERHRKVSFQEEFLVFLRKHGIAYDERDLWG